MFITRSCDLHYDRIGTEGKEKANENASSNNFV
jgi:hypothetical protein